MGHTNSTTYYNLPQFLTTDKPAWLTDVNNAMSDIDAAIHSAQDDATTAGTNASQALLDASAASTAAATADAKGAGACASIEAAFDSTTVYAIGSKVMYNSLLYRCTVAVTTPGPWTGSTNWERITVDSIIPGNAGDIGYSEFAVYPSGTAGEAINDLAYKASIRTGTFTPQTGYTNNSSFVKRTGNIVVAHINLTAPTAITTRTWVGAISGADYLPTVDVPFCCCGSATQGGFINRIITGYIGTNGSVFVGDDLSGSNSALDIYVDVVYMV